MKTTRKQKELKKRLQAAVNATRQGWPEVIGYSKSTQDAFAHGWRAAMMAVYAAVDGDKSI